MNFTLPHFSLHDFMYDFIVAIPAALIIGTAILGTRKLSNPWINRKVIHLSVTPGILMYLYVFKEPYAFFVYSIVFTIFLLMHHIRQNIMGWFQFEKNLGEVYFTLSFALLSLIFWHAREVGTTIMLFMAVGDAITGIVRSSVCKVRCKHWIGSLAMLITTTIIGYILVGVIGVLLAILATLFEKQWFIDDNISVPLVSTVTYFAVTSIISG